MELILCRHGNTFEKGDKIVRVGSSNDLPLTSAGIEQARLIASALILEKKIPSAVYCSPLQRTSKTAEVIISDLNLPVSAIIDPRINEIDYGRWSGLSDAEIEERYGRTSLEAWNLYSLWPPIGVWGSDEKQTIKGIKEFAYECIEKHKRDDVIIVISSNGVLRYFLKLINGEFEARAKSGSLKVKTGGVCSLILENNTWSLNYWNRQPA